MPLVSPFPLPSLMHSDIKDWWLLYQAPGALDMSGGLWFKCYTGHIRTPLSHGCESHDLWTTLTCLCQPWVPPPAAITNPLGKGGEFWWKNRDMLVLETSRPHLSLTQNAGEYFLFHPKIQQQHKRDLENLKSIYGHFQFSLECVYLAYGQSTGLKTGLWTSPAPPSL